MPSRRRGCRRKCRDLPDSAARRRGHRTRSPVRAPARRLRQVVGSAVNSDSTSPEVMPTFVISGVNDYMRWTACRIGSSTRSPAVVRRSSGSMGRDSALADNRRHCVPRCGFLEAKTGAAAGNPGCGMNFGGAVNTVQDAVDEAGETRDGQVAVVPERSGAGGALTHRVESLRNPSCVRFSRSRVGGRKGRLSFLNQGQTPATSSRNGLTAARKPGVFCECTLCPQFGTVTRRASGSAPTRRSPASGVNTFEFSPRTTSTG